MDHISILKNAFQTTIRYRALWILGFILALVGGGGGGSFPNPGNMGDNIQYQLDRGSIPPQFNPETFIPWIILGCGLLLILGIAATVVRYVLQAGIYRTLAKLELENETPTVRAGFREGWNRRTWRLFLQNLLVGIPLVIIVMLLLALAASPLLLLTTANDAASVIGVITAIGLILLWIAFMIVVATSISVLQQFWFRAAAIGDQSTTTAIKSAWHLVSANLRDVGIMWLLMLGIGILFGLLMIPIILLVLVVVGLVAAGPGFLIYQATESLAGALIWGVPVGLVLFVVPLSFISGLYLIFQTSVWNQMYNQLVERSGLVEA